MCGSQCPAWYDDAEVLDSEVVATACRQTATVMLQLLEDTVLYPCNVWTTVVALAVSLCPSHTHTKPELEQIGKWDLEAIEDICDLKVCLLQARRCEQGETSKHSVQPFLRRRRERTTQPRATSPTTRNYCQLATTKRSRDRYARLCLSNRRVQSERAILLPTLAQARYSKRPS